MQLTEREKQRMDKNICRPYRVNLLNLVMEAETAKAYDFCRKIDACRRDMNWLNVSLQCCSEGNVQTIKDMIRQDRAMIRFWTFCKNVFRDRKRRMTALLKSGRTVLEYRCGDISELFAGCPQNKTGKYRAYEISDIVDAYVKHVAEEEHIPYAYVRIRQDAGTGELDVQYGEACLVFDDIQCSGRKKRYLRYAVEDIREYRPMTLADKKSWPAWRPIISDILVTPAGKFKITAQSWWEMLNCISRLADKKAFVTGYRGIYIDVKVYRHPVKWG